MDAHSSLFHSIVSRLAAVPQEHFFDEFIKHVDYHFDSLTANSIGQLKKNNKSQLKGAFFELVCLRLCQHNAFPQMEQLANVWLFADFPDDQRQAFRLRKQDMGIDMIGLTITGKWVAIQCKYRREPKRKSIAVGDRQVRLYWSVPWKDLSTFYSLVACTGPPGGNWDQQIVITNCPSINRQGRKNSKYDIDGKKNVEDISICQGTFRSIPKDVWLAAVGYQGHKLTDVSPVTVEEEKVDVDHVRMKRLAHLLKQ